MANIDGTNGGETLNDTPGNDVIQGLGGADTIVVSKGGTDTVDGGDGSDRLVLDARDTGGGITMGAPTAGADGLSGSASWTNAAVTFQRIESFTIQSSTGSFSDNVVTGDGDDIFYHYGLDNTTYAADTIDLGGGSNDLLVADFSALTTHNVIGYLNFTPGHNLLTVDNVAKIDFTNVERLWLLGSALVDNVTGLDGDDILEGRAGNDTLSGGSGHDQLDGGLGDDTLSGGTGNDTFIIINGNDNAAGGADNDTLIIDYADAVTAFSTNGGPTANLGLGGFDGQFTIDATRRVAYSSIEQFDITTGSGNDTITTAGGNDFVHANGGDDFVDMGTGGGAADGGSGIDGISADLSATSFAVIWDLNTDTFTITGDFEFSRFEYFGTLKTGSGDDIVGTGEIQKNEIIDVGGGDDTITVMNGGDTIHGGAGFDTLIVNYGNATAAITTGNTSYQAGMIPTDPAGGYQGYIGDLINRTVTFDGIEKFNITTGSGNDIIQLPQGANVTDDTVDLGGGNDEVVLGRGVDMADGGGGTDGLEADLSQVTTGIVIDLNQTLNYTGANGSFFFNFEYFDERQNGFETGTGNDIVVTRDAALNDAVRLGAGNDSVTVYNGNDQVVGFDAIHGTPAGQGGNDTLVVDYSAATTAVTRTAALQTNSGEGYDSTLGDGSGTRSVTFYGFDQFDITTGSGNDNLNFSGINTAANQIFHTGAGSDTINLSQSTGTNFIDGGTGNDVMTGGMGNDTYVVDNALDLVNDIGGIDTIRTDLAAYNLIGHPDIENLTGTSNAGQSLRGNSSANIVSGAGGNDLIDLSDGGIDTGNGGGGDDGFFFGAQFRASDRVDGGAGTNDQIGLKGDYTGANALVLGANTIANVEAIVVQSGFSYDITTVDANVAAGQLLQVQATQLAAGQSLHFDGSAETNGAFRVFGGQGNDTMIGGAGDDGFYFGPGGFNGSDTLNGGGGTNDQLALDGDYTITLGGNFSNIEVVVLLHASATSGGTNHFDITAANSLVGAGETMTIFGLQVDTGIQFNGTAETDGAFKIYGGTVGDTLTGGAGDDWIFGGNGGDGLTGGAGNDTFYYDAVAQSVVGNEDIIFDFASGDKIDVSGIDAIVGGANDAFTFLGSGAFTNHAGELRAEDQGGSWIVQGDTNGDGTADFQLTLIVGDAHPISSTDFTF